MLVFQDVHSQRVFARDSRRRRLALAGGAEQREEARLQLAVCKVGERLRPPRARRQRSAAALPDGLKNPLGEEGGLRAAVELAAADASRPPAHSVSIDDRHSSGAFRASSGHKGRKKQASRSHHMGMLDGSAKQEGNPSAEGRGSAALLGTARVEMTSEL